MSVGKRGSGPPRRPRNPVAKNVRTPLYKPRVEQDKRWQKKLKDLGQEENPEVPAQDEDGRDVNGVDGKDRGE